MKIAHVGPVATTIPPPRSGSVEQMTSLLTEGLVARGHDVTLFATANSKTRATLHATFSRGYWEDDAWIHLEFARSVSQGRGFAFNLTSP